MRAQEPISPVERQFAELCASCHGEGGRGGERGPQLVPSRSLRSRTEDQIRNVIRAGTPGGMPPFALPDPELRALSQWLHARNAPAYDVAAGGDARAGGELFFGRAGCGGCHMVNGRGKVNGPDLSEIGRQLSIAELERAIDHSGPRSRSAADCPGWAWCPDDAWARVRVRLRGGPALDGYLRKERKHDLVLQTLDGRLLLLHRDEYVELTRTGPSAPPPIDPASRRDLLAFLSRRGGVPLGPVQHGAEPVSAAASEAVTRPKAGEWPGYHGRPDGNRHSALSQIHTGNVAGLEPAWIYSLPATNSETTPLVSDGIMFVSSQNRVCTLDARTGAEIWCWSRPRSDASTISGDAARGAHRGVALLGDRVFTSTDDAHLLSLNRLTGAVMWEVKMPEAAGRYGGTGAPLVVGDLVIAGMSGGDGPVTGFLAAYKADTGQLAWRFSPIPKPGDAAFDTWKGKAVEIGGGAPWLTGSYDPGLGLLYWPTGQPYPATDGRDRLGDNLYTNCVVALEPATGKLRWHFQFTPHDLHDWDATEPLVLADARFGGRERKLLLQANRNGFFYVLDRTNGEFLLGKPFVKKLTWASGIDPRGRPQLAQGNEPTEMGTKTCPAVRGATNWYSTAFNPATRLFYVMAVEDCNVYRRAQNGGYVPYAEPADPPAKVLRALDLETGRVAWEVPQVGAPEFNYSGVLSTAGGLLFYGETGGAFAAADAKTGRMLWRFETNAAWKASPMTYMVKGRQYVAIAAGSNIVAFRLPER
jgi:PQQ-dependent dehydrogenase (methanol/ethanol family)